MPHLYYRLTNTTDPEERLEDAVLYKALHDEFGDGLTLVPSDKRAPKDGLFFGRGKKSEFHDQNLLGTPGMPYWEDPAFQSGVSRSFIVTDLDGAQKEVARLHAEGKDAFLKSTKQKHFVGRVDQGQNFHEELDGIVYSFIDLEDCLMVQEAVDMQFEHRFLVMNGEVITHSPVAWHLTPMSRSSLKNETNFNTEDLHYQSPRIHDAIYSPTATMRMRAFAQKIADKSDEQHLCIDLAILGDNPETDPIECIEFNPMQPGAVGLYACDPVKIARATWDAMDPELRSTVEQRRDGLLPSGYVDPDEEHLTAREMARNAHPVIKEVMGGEDALTESYADLLPSTGMFKNDVPQESSISDEMIKRSQWIGRVELLLLVDDVMANLDEAEARMATLDLTNMLDKAAEDTPYRVRLRDWLQTGTDSSTVELRDLMAETDTEGRTYWNDLKFAHRIDTLDSASLHIEEAAVHLANMEDIRQLAVEYGARFEDIAEDEDLSRSYAWCVDKQDIMSGADLGRYDEAMADRGEDLEVEWDDDLDETPSP